MGLGPHADFIIAAYVMAVVVVVGLIVWVIFDYRVQRGILADLDARGIRRRSDAQPGKTHELGAA